MSTKSSPPLPTSSEKGPVLQDNEKGVLGEQDVAYEYVPINNGEDILALQDIDPALNAKMHIVNNVRILEIGFMFCFSVNGISVLECERSGNF